MVDGQYVEEALDETVPRGTVDQRANGSIRRPGAGGRTISDFFSDENIRRPMTRADYLNMRSVEEFHRREQAWWRKLYRYVRGWPPVKDMLGAMAASHAQTLDQLRAALVARADAEEDARGQRAVDSMIDPTV